LLTGYKIKKLRCKMKRTKLEEYAITNGLLCEITLQGGIAYCSLYKKDELYVRFFKAETLNGAIEKAINNHRGKKSDNRSKQEIQDEKTARMLRQRFSNRK
jgi:hypothetical protein